MSQHARQPRVTVVTPVHNGETYLAECIDSVLRQTYENLEYVIVNNCSTDGTVRIAEEYAARDRRIRIHHNQEFVGLIANHNIAARQVSAQSSYCKFVEADDWLFSECLTRMVEVAEEHPTVGIVGCYRLSGRWVDLDGLPYPSTVVPGRELCRRTLLGGPHVFGSPTSLLFRADLVRARAALFNEANIHSDRETCCELLQHSDFGFVHQVLVFNRVHEESVSAQFSRTMKTRFAGDLFVLKRYGPRVLSTDEYREQLARQGDEYYRYLAKSVYLMRGREFWDYHRKALADAGSPMSVPRLSMALARECMNMLLHPYSTGVKAYRRLRAIMADVTGAAQEPKKVADMRVVCGGGRS